MAEIAKSGVPSLSGTDVPPTHKLSGMKTGEAIAAGDACYIKKADGKIYRSTGAAVADAAYVDGWASQAVDANESITLLHGVRIRYGANLVPGTNYFLSGTVAGGIADAAST